MEPEPEDLIDTLLKLLVERIRQTVTQCEIDLLRNELKNADYDVLVFLAGGYSDKTQRA
jgi:hypothetical protein